jgi:hypothetical protein
MATRSHNAVTPRSPDSSAPTGHLIAHGGPTAARLPLDVIVAAFFADGRARGLSPRSLEQYAAAIESFRARARPPA